MKKLIFLFLFVPLFVFSQDIFGLWVGEFLDDKVEVEFLEDVAIFHYSDGSSNQFSYYFDSQNDLTLLFINNLGYYYEKIDSNSFILTPAFESDIPSIRFYRG